MSSDSLPFPLRRVATKSFGQPTQRTRMSAVSDEQLMELVQRDDHSAFEELFDRYHAIVRSVIARVLRNPEDVADVVQEAFIDAYQNCGSFDPSKGSVRTWICSVSRHRAIRRWHHLKSRQWQTESIDDTAYPLLHASLPTEWMRSIDFRKCLNRVLKNLNEKQRRTMELYYVEGFDLEAIASTLGDSRSNVRHYLYRGLAKLRRELTDARMLSGYFEFEDKSRDKEEAS